MKEHLLELICCPTCRQDLQLKPLDAEGSEIQEGVLFCTCGAVYPIVSGIPRLLSNALYEYPDFVAKYRTRLAGLGSETFAGELALDQGQRQVRSRFEFQWQQWGEEARLFGKSLDQMVANLTNERIGSQITAEFYPGKLVLDAGCGHGRYLAAFASLGAEVVGLDIGQGTEIARRYNAGRTGVHLVQGDILHLPFRPERFDLVFSDGVIHHTPSAADAFRQLAGAVKPGGHLYVWVYPRGGPLWESSQRLLRAITTRLPPRLLYGLCFVPVPLLSIVRTYSGTSLRNSSWRQCAQVVWDWYSPKYQSHHTPEEVQGWYKEAGFQQVELLPILVGAVGHKPHQHKE